MQILQELEEIEAKSVDEGDCLRLNFIKIARQILYLSHEENIDCDSSSEHVLELEKLVKRLESIRKAIRFCDDFINEAEAECIQQQQERMQIQSKTHRAKVLESEERQRRITELKEITVHGQEKVIKIDRIGPKTICWLKSVMNKGISEWDDCFAFDICDRTWVVKAASTKDIDSSLSLLWHLMLINEFFPSHDMLNALSQRTGTPSAEELAVILGKSYACDWVKMTREYVMTKGLSQSEVEFRAMLGDAKAKKCLEAQ